MQGTKFAKADKQQLAILFQYLEGCLEQIVKDNELGALKQALKVSATPYSALCRGGLLRARSQSKSSQNMKCCLQQVVPDNKLSALRACCMS